MWKLFIVPAFALIAGLWGLPSYSLYQLLRVVVALQAAAFALIFFNEERIWDKALSLFFLAIVIMFFPIFDIHFSRQDWRIIDIIAALSLISANLLIIKYDNQKDASKTEKFQQTIQNLNAENRKLKEKITSLETTLNSTKKFIKIENNKIDRDDYYDLIDEYDDLKNRYNTLKKGISILLNNKKVDIRNISINDLPMFKRLVDDNVISESDYNSIKKNVLNI